MERDDYERIIRVIDERIINLKREIGELIGKGPLGGNVADCGCLLDNGCCSDKGCCGDKGCCKHKSDDPFWDEFINIAERLGVTVERLIARIRELDPKLLGAR